MTLTHVFLKSEILNQANNQTLNHHRLIYHLSLYRITPTPLCLPLAISNHLPDATKHDTQDPAILTGKRFVTEVKHSISL